MPEGIKVRVADRRLLIWKGDGSGEYRRMDATDEEAKAAWQAEGVAQRTPNGFYLVLPQDPAVSDGFVLVGCDEHIEGQETITEHRDPETDLTDVETKAADAEAARAAEDEESYAREDAEPEGDDPDREAVEADAQNEQADAAEAKAAREGEDSPGVEDITGGP